MTWFDLTHELTADPWGRPSWRRRSLPGPGGVGDQDARLMAALDELLQVHNEMLSTRTRGADEDTDA